MKNMLGTTIKANAATAAHYSAILSLSRSFVSTGKRGEYFIEATAEVQVLRDIDFLTANGAIVVAAHGI